MVRTSTHAVAVALLGASLVFALLCGFASPAHAQAARDKDKELTTLAQDLDREAAELSTSDCAAACRALASIRRAADRICALDPDNRCTDARAKADAATKKVRAACPACAIASQPPSPPQEPSPPPPPAAVPPSPAPPRRELDAKTASTGSDQPAAESRRGSCAGCTTGGGAPTDLAGASLALTGLLLLVRRRAKKALRSRR